MVRLYVAYVSSLLAAPAPLVKNSFKCSAKEGSSQGSEIHITNSIVSTMNLGEGGGGGVHSYLFKVLGNSENLIIFLM